MAIDKIVEEKIRFGPAQYIPFIFLCLVDMNDGAQLVLSKILLLSRFFSYPCHQTVMESPSEHCLNVGVNLLSGNIFWIHYQWKTRRSAWKKEPYHDRDWSAVYIFIPVSVC